MQLPRSAVLMLALAALGASTPAPAVSPFLVDDARVNDPGGCQLEAFATAQRRESERDTGFVLGCTPASRFTSTEFSLAANRTHNAAAGVSSGAAVQIKTLQTPMNSEGGTAGWGLVTSVGMARQHPADADSAWNPYFNLVVSGALPGDVLVLHANLGALRDRPATRTLHTAGFALEMALTERLSAIAERYLQEAEQGRKQIGLRYAILPERLQIDGLTGTQVQADGTRRNWTSIGLRLFF